VQITGRPRETIRRKLERLEAEGRLLRQADGYTVALTSVDPQMQALGVDSVRRFMEASRVIGAALRDAEQVLERERS
jgi:DeoR/GlpR family transcriptional regulator of sugar metabolism